MTTTEHAPLPICPPRPRPAVTLAAPSGTVTIRVSDDETAATVLALALEQDGPGLDPLCALLELLGLEVVLQFREEPAALDTSLVHVVGPAGAWAIARDGERPGFYGRPLQGRMPWGDGEEAPRGRALAAHLLSLRGGAA